MTDEGTATDAAGTEGQPGLLPLARVPTGVAGLDLVLGGGLPVGGAYLVAGTPGTGKTTLGNQLAFAHAAGGGVARRRHRSWPRPTTGCWPTWRGFRFFDPAPVGTGVHYLSLVSGPGGGRVGRGAAPRSGGCVRDLGATLLVVDGTGILEDVAPSAPDFRRFTARLQAQSALLGCTTLLLDQPPARADRRRSPPTSTAWWS